MRNSATRPSEEYPVDGLIAVGQDGRVRACNDPCAALLGYDANELIGSDVALLMPAELQADQVAPLTEGAASQRHIGAGRPVTARRKDRSNVILHLTESSGTMDGRAILMGVLHDIAHPGSALARCEARTQSILDAFSDAVVIVDEFGSIESFSTTATELFGYESGEMIGKNVKVLLPPFRQASGDIPELLSPESESRDTAESHVVIGQRRDGTVFPMELAIGEIRGGPKRLFTTFVRDLTKRRSTAQRLEDLQAELLHVSRLSVMGQMSAAIAHEINQPLAAISNYVKAAKRVLDSAEGDAHTIRRAQELIDKSAGQVYRASEIIRNLRQFVEKRTGRREPEDLNKVVQEALALAFVGTAHQGVKVSLDLDESLPPVSINRIQIQQVLVNLIRNSIESMQATPRRELSIATTPGAQDVALVSVDDTGAGLPLEVSERLFQPFVTTKETGMGIGLSICRSIVQAHGGRIWLLKSGPDGTGFRFSVPLAQNLKVAE